MIRYLTYQQINKQRWDDCIVTADNGLIYATAGYLDAMAKQWDALVLGDYEAVMPLTWNKKWGIYYLYQAPFTACLGLFGKNISAELLEEFLQQIPSKFKYWDISLNQGNYFLLQNFNLVQRMNFVLHLDKPYENLYAAYRDNIKRNIKKAEKLNCFIKKNIAVDEVIALSAFQSKSFSNLTDEDFSRFKNLYLNLYKHGQAITYGVCNAAGELLSSCVFYFFKNRAYYILVGNHPNGKTIGASHALIDAFIKDHAAQDLILDFEGSDIANLAFFYSSFGASEEKYVALKQNNLPIFIRRFKK